MNNNPLSVLPKNSRQFFISGPVGQLDCLEIMPNTTTPEKTGIAIIFHPDPKGGGSYTNKIVQTIAKTLTQKGYICICPNLRSVGLSQGIHDYGVGEIEDAKAIYEYCKNHYSSSKLILAGFSFGAFIANTMSHIVEEYSKLILIAPAVTRYKLEVLNPSKTIVVHGEEDEVIEIEEALKWGKANSQPIIWQPSTGHFFHGKLVELQNLLNSFNL